MPLLHDPRKAIELLRNHLATHDQPLVFLFGAGTSCAVINPNTQAPLIPAVAALTTACESSVVNKSEKFREAWKKICDECAAIHIPCNIETILSRVRAKIAALGPDDSSLGLEFAELELFEKTLCEEIARQVSPSEQSIPNETAHDRFASWIRRIRRKSPIEIFTTNYDILIERSLEIASIPLFDGFSGSHSPFFNTECFEDDSQMPPREWVRLWKLHGSVNWAAKHKDHRLRIVRDPGTTNGQMILPSHLKYDESKKLPYQALMDRLRLALKQQGALLITSGFSFSDQHINSIVLEALDSHPLTHVICLQYGGLTEDSDLARIAMRNSNFILLGRNAAVIQGAYGTWKLSTPIDENTAAFMKIAFTATDPETASDGQFELGDFDKLSRFLETMDIAGGSSQ